VLGEKVYEGFGVWFLREVEAEVTRGLLENCAFGNASEARDTEVVADLAEEGLMFRRPHLIIYYTHYLIPRMVSGQRLRALRSKSVIATFGGVAYYCAFSWTEIHKPREEGSHGICSAPGIYHKDDGQFEYAGYFVGGTLLAIVAVVKAHHALYDADVGGGGCCDGAAACTERGGACCDGAAAYTGTAIAGEKGTDVVGTGHKGVEVDAGSSAYRLMELRINIVGSALEGLHSVALLSEKCH
jgi:hypothetical protein